ncbi:MAG: peptide chain release factor N(5)-glutamine methyltransferase [Caulobacteraceae bacterium]
MESIVEVLKKAVGMLKQGKHTDTPVLDAELILLHAMKGSGRNFDRIKLITQKDAELEEQTAKEYLKLIDERNQGKPVQYITNEQEFMGMPLYVAEGVLIPRPDTEIVVEKVLELVKSSDKLNIIDMCTGSGAIAVSLARNLAGSRLYAVDISDIALKCCRVNVGKYNLENRVQVIKSDLFEAMAGRGLENAADIIVSNPPYIKNSEIEKLSINVRGYEPFLALDGGSDGLAYYRRICSDAHKYLRSGGLLAFEIGYEQGSAVKNIMEESGFYAGMDVERDLAGLDRCIWGYRV